MTYEWEENAMKCCRWNWIVVALPLMLIFVSGCAMFGLQQAGPETAEMDRIERIVYRKAGGFVRDCVLIGEPVAIHPRLRITEVELDRDSRKIDIHFNTFFADIPFREENTAEIYAAMRKHLGFRFRNYDLSLYARRTPIGELIPNYYRADTTQYDRSRLPKKEERPLPVVRNVSQPFRPTQGLYDRNIALWHSHGWYYEHKLQRWEWQRARVYQIVEDIFPMAFTVPYLIPMLENAGANVFVPRERDVQTHEVIVDNDSSHAQSQYRETGSWTDVDSLPGFAIGKPPYTGNENPFRLGTARMGSAETDTLQAVTWIPDIPEKGRYAVTIAYPSLANSSDSARYTVFHSGGSTGFLVNQQIGGGTWIYLGTFPFTAGCHEEIGKVVLANAAQDSGKVITADAVRFGGGMGNIAREGKTSGRPRFTEAARYYLQYAGIPDTLVWSFNGDTVDYKDDYQCRGEWVNYLKGAPYGPNEDRTTKGLGIPIDVSLAFHTDAGSRPDDIVIGTLSIYDTEGADSTFLFPDSVSRLANRDLADLLQTQIVEDIRVKYDPVWNRRMLWDRGYSEAYRPNVPAVLLELLSHHNFLDMKFGLDPRFRFDVSRSIYKSMLRFLATQYDEPYIVQPLPVSHLHLNFTEDRNVRLQWRETVDPLEPSALADRYIIYTRRGDSGFDNGRMVDTTVCLLKNPEPGIVYSFKVTAVNAGGESFPSEVLSVCLQDTTRAPVMIVNGFDRVSPPAALEAGDYKSFFDLWDQGVPDRYDLCYTGSQYELRFDAPWLDDDSPGHGASFADYETQIIAGNTFDYPLRHGQSIHALGRSFISASDEAVMGGDIDLSQYPLVDLIMGEEKITPWPKPGPARQFEVFPLALQQKLREYCQAGGKLFASGAYIASDPFIFAAEDSSGIHFAMDVLKYRWRTNHAVRQGGVYAVDPDFKEPAAQFEFITERNAQFYAAEAPDALEPAPGSNAKTVLRYSETNSSAAVGWKGEYGVLVFGFPFETIKGTQNRDAVMQAVFRFLEE